MYTAISERGGFFINGLFCFAINNYFHKKIMKKYTLIIACSFLFTCNLQAQSAEDSVKATINKLFDAMKNADSKSLLECFADSAILQTVAEKNGNVSVRTEDVKEFANFISTQ